MKLNDKARENLIITALEGGSNYWYLIDEKNTKLISEHKTEEKPCLSEAFFTAIQKGKTIEIFDIENENEKLGEINLESIKKAEEILLKDYQYIFANILKEEDDANDADIWFQLAVMGEVVFG